VFITGIGRGTPPKRYLQSQCWDAALDAPFMQTLSPRSRALIKKVLLGNNGIESRYLALDALPEVFDAAPDRLHARFKNHAPAVATQATERALAAAQVDSRAVDAIIISTCTGYLCPGLTSYVAENLKLRPDVFALDLVGQGCGAALPNLRAAEACLQSRGCERVLSVAVEICSAAFYLDDDPGVLISACLFGDAAGAAVLSSTPAENRRKVQWRATGSLLDPSTRDLLRFETKEGKLRNILTPQVPQLAAEYASKVLVDVLQRADVAREQISTWIWHAGGRDVLLALRDKLRLEDEDLMWSARVLRHYGNISSPFVLHVLDEALTGAAPGGYWWMSSFGAGFSCHGALLEVEG
jgi:predicted naringenin-chalcone synthase